MDETLMAPVWEILRWHHPGMLVVLVDAGLLDPASIRPAGGDLPIGEIDRLMAHDAYRRVRGAIRQVRWAS